MLLEATTEKSPDGVETDASQGYSHVYAYRCDRYNVGDQNIDVNNLEFVTLVLTGLYMCL